MPRSLCYYASEVSVTHSEEVLTALLSKCTVVTARPQRKRLKEYLYNRYVECRKKCEHQVTGAARGGDGGGSTRQSCMETSGLWSIIRLSSCVVSICRGSTSQQ